jgi:uncharacterized protein (TIGR00730 family)
MIVGIFCSSREIARTYENAIIDALVMLFSVYHGSLQLSYGGGNKGIMGLVLQEAISHQIPITGHNLEKWALPGEQIYPTLLERQKGIVDSSDMYLVFPGGIGTIYELCQVLCHNDVERLNKPVIIYNINGLFDTFVLFLEELISKQLMDRERLVLSVVTTIEEFYELLTRLKNENEMD